MLHILYRISFFCIAFFLSFIPLLSQSSLKNLEINILYALLADELHHNPEFAAARDSSKEIPIEILSSLVILVRNHCPESLNTIDTKILNTLYKKIIQEYIKNNTKSHIPERAPRDNEPQLSDAPQLTKIPRDMYIQGNLDVGGAITTNNSNVVSSQGISQDNALARFDGTSGKIIQNSALIGTDFTSSTQNNVAIKADDGTTTNITLALVPKGTGAFTASIPDGTSAGGNARGAFAVDLQHSRSTASQIASGSQSAIGGGSFNSATASFATVAGGTGNISQSSAATVGGGANNTASNASATVAGGSGNIASGSLATVAGGGSNTASGITAPTVGGGQSNIASNFYATVPGGLSNTASGQYSFAAGRRAKAINDGAFVWADSTDADFNSPGIDTFNVRATNGAFFTGDMTISGTITAANLGVSAVTSTGASQNKAIARFSSTSGTVIQNSALIATDFTSSTQNNVAIQADDGVTANITLALVPKGTGALTTAIPDATATGGNARGTNAIDLQTSRAAATQVASGASSVVGGGASNTASGSFATTPGGNLNTTTGDYSFAAGRRAKANEQGTFVWADSTDADFNSTGINTFNVRATGGAVFTGTITSPNFPASSQDNAIARFDGTTGKLIQNSALIAADFTAITQNNVAIQADDGVTANITLALVPKGTGALSTAIPDATATGGNARGTNAADLQTSRAAATQVASGASSVVGGGASNTASGSFAITPGGNLNTAAGDYSFAAGRRAKANEQGTFVWADSTDADFNSAGINTFNVRATNGSFFTGDLTLTGSITATNIITDTAVVKNSSTSQDNAIARFDGTSGKLIQNSALIATDFTAVTQNNVAIRADDGTTTNITLALVPKGTGALTTAIPDATATGGNARGTNAVDLQTSRAAATQVASGASSVVGGGASNTASALISTVAGGSFNIASGTASIVAGGQSSTASGINSTVCGGVFNTAAGDYSFAIGRRAKANEQGTFVWADSTDADFNSAGINTFNVRCTGGAVFTGTITSPNFPASSQDNAIARFDGTSGKLIQNSALIATDFTAVTQNNVAIQADDGSTANITLALVPKGTGALTAAIPDATATGGNARGTNAVDLQTSRAAATQVASGASSTVIGGVSNVASGSFATTLGGNLNTATGDYSFAAGRRSQATHQGTFVWADSTDANFNSAGTDSFNVRSYGGSFFVGDMLITGSPGALATPANLLLYTNGSGIALQVDGGGIATDLPLALVPKGNGPLTAAISDGTTTGGNSRGVNAIDLQTSRTLSATDVASGIASTIPGGQNNRASGDYSFAAGRRAKATHLGSFAWADSNNSDFNSAAGDSFNVRASGGTFIYSNVILSSGVALNAGASSWTSICDRNRKENITPVNEIEVLQKVAALPIAIFNYKSQEPSIKHMGPMAQDFYPAFGLGEDPLGITTQDANGVALAAIKGLYILLLEYQTTIKELRNRIEQLEKC